jgi:hypothetical protein
VKTLLVLCALVAVAEADKRCVIEKVPPAVAKKFTEPACHRAPKAMEKPLTKAIAKDFNPTQTGGKPSVKFPCDGLGDKIDEIVLETGGGHGGTLNLFRARRAAAGSQANADKYDVRGIVFSGASMTHQPANPPFERVAGTVTIDIDRLRAATTAEVTEVFPPRKKGEFPGMMDSWSSHDFHILIRLVDSDGRVVERKYTGYESSSHQSVFLGLQIAEQTLDAITSLTPTKDAADADDRAFFADRFNAAIPHFDEDFYWWVMERYVDMARFLGTPKIIAGLLTRMTVADPKDRSHVDARHDALEALANITGWDARKNNATDETAAKAYLAQCQ